MTLLRFLKTFEQTHKIKIGKSFKRVDSDCIFCVLDCTTNCTLVIGGETVLPLQNHFVVVFTLQNHRLFYSRLETAGN